MIVSHRHRFVFMKTLKTAGTSVEIALSGVCGPDDVVGRLPAADERLRADRPGPGWQNVVTPQGERIHEHVHASKARRLIGREVWDSYTKLAVERNPWDLVVSLYFWVDRHRHDLSFEEFLETPPPTNVARRNFQIDHIGGVIAVDRVLRFESLATDLDDTWDDLDLPGRPDLPHAKSGLRTDVGGYRELYTPTTRDVVGDLFARQVAEFGYDF